MSFFATCVYLRGNLRVCLATQRKSLRKFNLRPLVTTCRSVWPCKCPNKCVFYFMIFLNFLWWSLPKFSMYIAWDANLNAKKMAFVQAVFSSFADLYLSLLRKNGSYRFPCKTSSDQSKISTTRAPNFTKFYRRKRGARKFTVSFAYRETLTFSFERAQITWAFVLSERAIVNLRWLWRQRRVWR